MATEQSTEEIVNSLWPVLSRQVGERTVAGAELMELMLLARGPLTRREHELWAGDMLVNDDRELLPRVGRATGTGISVYLGNRRVASFGGLDTGGALELGGYADAELVDAVLRQGRHFSGTIEEAGRRMIVAARPLQNPGASKEYGALGMVEAHQDIESLRQGLEVALREGTGTTGHSARDRQADRIASIMKFIDDVARRLQLLALNGNIIAAQAGDHGRAFRVVCRELGSLAEQSKETVGEVRGLLAELRAATQTETPTRMDEGAHDPGPDEPAAGA